MSSLQKDRILQLRGETLYDRDGEKIGTVDEIYLDADSGAPEWALVSTGLFGTKRTFVPVSDATESDGGLRVPFDKATLKDAPTIEPDGQLSRSEEAELYRHYGRDYGDTGTTTGRDTSGPTTDDAMTRS
jgi:sporulation protein YlmC with PRC-barrel domain